VHSRASVGPEPHPGAEAVAFLAQLIRLQREVRDVDRRLDRIESEMHEALNPFNRARVEEYL
jgi:hypothetical protein